MRAAQRRRRRIDTTINPPSAPSADVGSGTASNSKDRSSGDVNGRQPWPSYASNATKLSPWFDVFQNQIEPWLSTYPATPTDSMYCPAGSACGVASVAVCCQTWVLLKLSNPVSTGSVAPVA